ncbi:MAG: DUF1343 domain-containing protein [bacterium]|nr:DUF1343 domain-containing protein [bacterium]
MGYRWFVWGLVAMLACSAYAGPAPKVQPGVDVLISDGFKPLVGKRVGLITNPTGVTSDLRSTVDVLHAAPKVSLVALFGPEHGVRGDVYAGGKVTDTRDAKTGVPVYSLYGKNRRPNAEMLEGVDALVFDIQDIGSRSYTYISTMAAAMEGAAEHGVPFVVLDRPNPISGERIEGRLLNLEYKSFVGYLPVPYAHGMTVGELARMINGEGWLPEGAKCDLHVVPMSGWRREMYFDQTGLPWVPTSPHIPRADSSAFYAATGILGELRVLSEGVGYTLPFELLGAPGLDAEALAGDLNARKLPGVIFRPMYYKPYYATYKTEDCGGVQIHLTDQRRARLTDIQFHVMDYLRRVHPEKPLFGAKRDRMFDKVCGTDAVRKMFLAGKPIQDILAHWNAGLDEFRARRAKYLLYD